MTVPNPEWMKLANAKVNPHAPKLRSLSPNQWQALFKWGRKYKERFDGKGANYVAEVCRDSRKESWRRTQMHDFNKNWEPCPVTRLDENAVNELIKHARIEL